MRAVLLVFHIAAAALSIHIMHICIGPSFDEKTTRSRHVLVCNIRYTAIRLYSTSTTQVCSRLKRVQLSDKLSTHTLYTGSIR